MSKTNKNNGDGTLSNSTLGSHLWEAASILHRRLRPIAAERHHPWT